ncbi:hypothetical protein MW290_21010 [Aquincola tertiaricarbonis]|uniref:Uncharacterized protein n=1 Tax=Aquincola tertiaricarbonis TaxID=391953 RepID=A0ABY4SGR8_AQUTE|nr:hypothetical protein [Aquincola tertiaricarbonis]URI11426.1 hypothetical protein MW290_21010 [Aquincola tertiaricarbonis]
MYSPSTPPVSAEHAALLDRLTCWLRLHADAGRLPWVVDPAASEAVVRGHCVGVRATFPAEAGRIVFGLAADHPGRRHCVALLPTALAAFLAADVGRSAAWHGTRADIAAALQPLLERGFVLRFPERLLVDDVGLPTAAARVLFAQEPRGFVLPLGAPRGLVLGDGADVPPAAAARPSVGGGAA